MKRSPLQLNSRALAVGGVVLLLLVAYTAVLARSLARHPYEGLYGQDSYAYYFGAEALGREMAGLPPQPGNPFPSPGSRWPIGYYLHILAGELFGAGPGGGRAITLAMTLLCPVLLCLLVIALRPVRTRWVSLVAGLAAGLALGLSATYARMGLSLMADVPALFWALLSLYCLVRAYPPEETISTAGRAAWLAGAGAALGMAVSVRYGSVLAVAPAAGYLGLRWWQRSARQAESERPQTRPSRAMPGALWLVGGLILGLAPQITYLLLHSGGPADTSYSAFLQSWSPVNLFSSNFTTADGTASYANSNIVFYLLSPLWDAPMGFFSWLYIPAMALGLGALVKMRSWAVLGLLLAWWAVPAVFFAGTSYQAHRFAIVYLPALAALAGTGTGVCMEALLAPFGSTRRPLAVPLGLAALAIIACAGLGAYRGVQSVDAWIGTHSAWQTQERAVADVARSAVARQEGQPRLLSFGMTAALYYYLRWPTAELYNEDERSIDAFLGDTQPGPRLLVLPEASMDKQWAGTPVQARWQYVGRTYALDRAASSGDYTVYRVGSRR